MDEPAISTYLSKWAKQATSTGSWLDAGLETTANFSSSSFICTNSKVIPFEFSVMLKRGKHPVADLEVY